MISENYSYNILKFRNQPLQYPLQMSKKKRKSSMCKYLKMHQSSLYSIGWVAFWITIELWLYIIGWFVATSSSCIDLTLSLPSTSYNSASSLSFTVPFFNCLKSKIIQLGKHLRQKIYHTNNIMTLTCITKYKLILHTL